MTAKRQGSSGHPSKLKTPELLLFAAADLFGGGGQAIISVLFFVFMTNVLRISPGWAGTIVMITKIWDAVFDPMLGVISDNTRGRMGRRRPYIFWGGVLLLGAMALLWLPVSFESEIARVVYVTAAYLFYCTVSSMIAIPYASMSTEITAEFQLTNRVNMTRLVFSLVATAIYTLLPTMLFDRLTDGSLTPAGFYLIVVLGLGAPLAIPVILTGLLARERVPYGEHKSSFSLDVFIRPLKVRAFRKLLGLYLAQSITLDIISTVILYYGMYVVPGISATVFLGAFLGIQLLMFPVMSRMLGTVPKTTIYRFGLPLSILGAAGIAFFPSGGSPALVYALAALTALGFAGAQTMTWIMFPDVVDIGDLSLGERITGSFGGLMSFIRTISYAIAAFIIGQALTWAGFITPGGSDPSPLQPDSTLWTIRLIILLSFVLLMGGAWVAAGRFPLSPALSKNVKSLLQKREAGRLDAEDQAQRDQIVRDLG